MADSAYKNGEDAYRKICGYCHERAIVGPELKGRGLPPEFFTIMARNGFNAMPAFPASFIDDKLLREVGEYLAKSKLP